MNVQYQKFCLTPQVEEVVFCIENKERLSSMSVQDMVQLKAELYGLYNYSNQELSDYFNSPNKKISEKSITTDEEKRVYKALVRLNAHARRRMLQIAKDYKAKNPSSNRKDIQDLSFIFRNNGKNLTPYPEVNLMNAEVAWYYHQKLIERKKSVWQKLARRKVLQVWDAAKETLQSCLSKVEYLLTDDCSPSSSKLTPQGVSSIKHNERTH